MTKLVKLLVIGGSSTAVAGGAAAGVAVAVTNKKESKNKGYDLTIEAMDKTLAANAKSSLAAEQAAKAAAQKEMLDAIAAMDNTLDANAKSSLAAELAAKASAEKEMRDAIAVMDGILQAYWNSSNKAAEEAEDADYVATRQAEHAEHRAEVEAYNKEQLELESQIVRQEALEQAKRDLHDKKTLDEDKANDAIFWAQQVSSSTLKFIESITSGELNAYAPDYKLEELINEVKSLDAIINSFEPNIKDLNDIIAEIKVTIAEIKLNAIPTAIPQLIPTAIPQLTASTIYSIPDFSAEYKAGKIMTAGDFVKAFRQEFLAKYTPEQLTQATNDVKFLRTGFYAQEKMSEIHIFVRDLFLKYFPQLEKEFNDFVSGGFKNWYEAIFYAEHGSSNYGIKFNLLNYLLNPENENKATFSEFVRGEWDQIGEHHKTQFDGKYWVGQSNPGQWEIDNWYKSQNPSVDYDTHIEQKIRTFFAAIDKQTTTTPNAALYNVNTFNAAIDDLKSRPEVLAPNRANEKATEYVMAIQPGHIFEGGQWEHGVKFQVVSSVINAHDDSKVELKLAAISTWSMPQTFSVEIGGFKVSNGIKVADFMAELKRRISANSTAKDFIGSHIVPGVTTSVFNATKTIFENYLKELNVQGAEKFVGLIAQSAIASNVFKPTNFQNNQWTKAVSELTYSEYVSHKGNSALAQEWAKVMDSL